MIQNKEQMSLQWISSSLLCTIIFELLHISQLFTFHLSTLMLIITILLCSAAPIPSLVLCHKIIKRDFLGTVFNVHIAILLGLTGIVVFFEMVTVLTLLLGYDTHGWGCGVMIYLSWLWNNAVQFGVTVSIIFRLATST